MNQADIRKANWAFFPVEGRMKHTLRLCLAVAMLVACKGEQGPPGPQGMRGDIGPAGPAGPQGPGSVTSISTGAGLIGGPITTNGTISVDPTSVPLLASANQFTNVNSFRAETRFFGNLITYAVMANIQQNATFQGTIDAMASASIVKRDGSLALFTQATASAFADVRNNDSWFGVRPERGSFLAVVAGFGGLRAAGQTAYVMHGAPTGAGSNTGGFGFKVVHNGATRVLYGIMLDGTPGEVVLDSNVGSSPKRLIAIYRGTQLDFIDNGVVTGSLPVTGTNGAFATYSVRLENNQAATAADIVIFALAVGLPLTSN